MSSACLVPFLVTFIGEKIHRRGKKILKLSPIIHQGSRFFLNKVVSPEKTITIITIAWRCSHNCYKCILRVFSTLRVEAFYKFHSAKRSYYSCNIM